MNRIVVFCGSNPGNNSIYREEAYRLGEKLAAHHIGLVYGGSDIGLMGAVANGVITHHGEVIGVLPRFLRGKEFAHNGLSELILVDTMHERKAKMHELSDGIITLPGGFGTLEEFFEMLTWAQLGLHQKPIAILNVDGFYDPLLLLIRDMTDKGFLKEIYRQMLLVSDSIDELLLLMKQYQAPPVDQWITEEEI